MSHRRRDLQSPQNLLSGARTHRSVPFPLCLFPSSLSWLCFAALSQHDVDSQIHSFTLLMSSPHHVNALPKRRFCSRRTDRGSFFQRFIRLQERLLYHHTHSSKLALALAGHMGCLHNTLTRPPLNDRIGSPRDSRSSFRSQVLPSKTIQYDRDDAYEVSCPSPRHGELEADALGSFRGLSILPAKRTL